MRRKVAVDSRHRSSDSNDQLLSPFSTHWLFVRTHLRIGMALMRKRENRYKRAGVFRIVKKFGPTIAPHLNAAA